MTSFVEKANKKHSYLYDYSIVEYKDSHTNVKIKCSIHGIFEQTPTNHLSGKGCRQCARIKNANSQRLSKDEFIIKANTIHDNKYDYSETQYGKNNTIRIEIKCPIHGTFEQTPHGHLSGRGCLHCNIKKKSNTDVFIEKAKIVHSDIYDYSEVIYKRAIRKVKIKCLTHGIFEQTPNDHLKGRGCFECGRIKIANVQRSNKEEFINKSNKIHNELYDYRLFEYIDAHTKGKIFCKKHGEFKQSPNGHLAGKGCLKCTHMVSKAETKWLDGFNISIRNHSIKIKNKRINVDGYDPDTNTVFEFHGDYWHGNPEVFDLNDYNKTTKCTFRKLYEKTLEKERLIRNAGYNLVIMWENDFRNIVV